MNKVDEIQRVLDCVDATLEVEKLYVSKESRLVTSKFLAGKLTSRQAIAEIKRIYGL